MGEGEHRSARPTPTLIAVVIATAIGAVALPAWVVTHPPSLAKATFARVVRTPTRVVPPAELPPVEPVAFQDLDPQDARAYNATIPFSTDPNPAARPFRLPDDDLDRQRAIDCLAAAEWYEAGDDATGERAVAQVVLNRLRHPAFPKTVCGVVFEGAERSTGCQFTFTCDGALARSPSDAAWKRAEEIAEAALSGAVFAPVGYSTHYHTDWVVPYWQSSLDKVAAVGTHLFFRWTGWWGTPPAFNRSYAGVEPVIAKMAKLSPAHLTGAALAEAGAAEVEAAAAAGTLKPLPDDPNSFLVTVDAATPPATFPKIATTACAKRTYCKFLIWAGRDDAPTKLPLDALQVAAMSFSYLRDQGRGVDKMLWNCTVYPRSQPTECMKAQVFAPLTAKPDADADARATTSLRSPVALPTGVPDELTGVRRRGSLSPAPRATPAPLLVGPPAPVSGSDEQVGR